MQHVGGEHAADGAVRDADVSAAAVHGPPAPHAGLRGAVRADDAAAVAGPGAGTRRVLPQGPHAAAHPRRQGQHTATSTSTAPAGGQRERGEGGGKGRGREKGKGGQRGGGGGQGDGRREIGKENREGKKRGKEAR